MGSNSCAYSQEPICVSEVESKSCAYSQERYSEFISNPAAAFAEFKELNPELCRVSECDKLELKRLCEEGKRRGLVASNARDRIEELKRAIETDSDEEIVQTLVREKTVFTDSMIAIKEIKAEIHGIQKRIELKKSLAQNRFKVWYENLGKN